MNARIVLLLCLLSPTENVNNMVRCPGLSAEQTLRATRLKMGLHGISYKTTYQEYINGLV
jgi:hypothetical protein